MTTVLPLEGSPKVSTLDELRVLNESCTRCPLNVDRGHVVFGEGDPAAELLVLGEAPGRLEDETGRPFIGQSGRLLTELLAGAGLTRDEVFITSVVKSRPPRNRDPKPEEVAACRVWLDAQLQLLPVRVVLSVGNFATRSLLDTKEGVTTLRGRVHTTPSGLQVVPTFHPAAVMRSQVKLRALADEDYALAASLLGSSRRSSP